MSYTYTVIERFLKYVKIDTQSDPYSKTCPSTEKQKDLGRMLLAELLEIGITDAEMDEWGYIYATIPSNTDKSVPTICFCSHMDTSPESSGKDVKPIIHSNYDGDLISLPIGGITIDPKEHTDLQAQVGNSIITASGDTLLGADNKAGVAEIMDMAHYFTNHPEAKHGDIRILFTPDEEIGRGADKVNIEKLNAEFGYTVDGETLGSIEDETFSADGVVVKIFGVNTHPGFAKNKMENAARIASDFIAALPKDSWSPETTNGREGFVHPYEMKSGAEEAEITFIIRSFIDSELKIYEKRLEDLLKSVMVNYPNSTYEFEVKEQYRNMKNILDGRSEIVAYAEEAIARAGLEVKKGSIRGGTDGSKLSFMGLPCPNVFAGEHAFHSKKEWVSVQDMHRAVDTLINIAQIWEERSE
jgi:tripeptide aminopeptidase